MLRVEKNYCCGCAACAKICPKQCICMEEDFEGFKFPIIDENKCISCGLCEKACPVVNKKVNEVTGKVLAYACMNLNEEIRRESSSGGVFSLLAENVIDKEGVVYGAAFDSEAMVYHVGIEKKADIKLLRGSKYLQSDLKDTFWEIKEHLDNKRVVLFSGTPCQNAGLKSFLQTNYENLYCVDFICHGVPSPMIWKRYLLYLEKKLRKSRNRRLPPSFRLKLESWINYSVFIPFEKDTEYSREHHQDSFMKVFMKNIILRLSCYDCKFKPSTAISDITLADFWGISKVLPDMNDDKGTSLCIVNSENGRKLFSEVSEKMKWQKVNLQEAVRHNVAYYKSVKKTKKRKKFFAKLDICDLEKLMNSMSRDSLLVRGKQILRKILIRS